MTKKVVSITQSPMNAKQWFVQLECGHERWITRKKRPTCTTLVCVLCQLNELTDEVESA